MKPHREYRNKQEKESQIKHNILVDKSALEGVKLTKSPVQVKEAGEELYTDTEKALIQSYERYMDPTAATKWAEEKMQEMQESMKELNRDMFKDMLLSNNVMVHTSGTGEGRRVVPGTEEWWQNKEKIAKLMQAQTEKTANQLLYPDTSNTLNNGIMDRVQTYKQSEADTYNTLEEILTEIKAVGSMLYIKMPEVEEIGYIINVMEKLQHTISTGKYIQQDGTK